MRVTESPIVAANRGAAHPCAERRLTWQGSGTSGAERVPFIGRAAVSTDTRAGGGAGSSFPPFWGEERLQPPLLCSLRKGRSYSKSNLRKKKQLNPTPKRRKFTK